MFSKSSPCSLGQYGSCSTAHQPAELSENISQNLFHNLPPQTLEITGMLKWCAWKGVRLNCSSIFTMFPTDRGMCCSFNKQRAEAMFKDSKYRDSITKFTDRDKETSFQSSEVPEW